MLRYSNSVQLLICNEDDMAAHGFGGPNNGGNAGVVTNALCTCHMGLQNLELFS